MESKGKTKILFILNPGSGNHSIDWRKEIEDYFSPLDYSIDFFTLHKNCNIEEIKSKIKSYDPNKVVAVGGDGTINLVAQCILDQRIPLGILPAGSANGLAKELGISEVPGIAIPILLEGRVKKIHAISVNDKLCIHLSDIGHNARMIKDFQSENVRGLWGYLKSTLRVAKNAFLVNPMMKVSLTLDSEIIHLKAAMIVIANATKYGSGAMINPAGNLEDDVFEVIVIKKISILEILKMIIPHASFNPNKTAVFKTKTLKMVISHRMHFQVDGEYLGKVTKIEAHLLPAALGILVPSNIPV